MRFPSIRLSATLRIITIILGSLMAFFFLLFGAANLINPDAPDSYLNQNARVSVMLILTGLSSIYALFHPYSGGILLCICAVSFGLIVHSTAVLVLAAPILLLGVFFLCAVVFPDKKSRKNRINLLEGARVYEHHLLHSRDVSLRRLVGFGFKRTIQGVVVSY